MASLLYPWWQISNRLLVPSKPLSHDKFLAAMQVW